MNLDKTLVLITLVSSEGSDMPAQASLLYTLSLEIEEDLDQVKQLVPLYMPVWVLEAVMQYLHFQSKPLMNL